MKTEFSTNTEADETPERPFFAGGVSFGRYGLASGKSGPAFAPERRCAWCQTILTTGTQLASHTICLACLEVEVAKQLAQQEGL